MKNIKQDSAKRLAKNTIYMYIRMIVVVLISIYTSRLLLKQLGVVDYGIYNLVGSVVAIFASIRMMFASSTQRFLNVEMGRGNAERLNQVFSMSIIVNLIIAIIFALLVEIVGIWFISNKINIPHHRISSAYYLLHFSVATSVISIMTTPYDAVIIANEKMNFYSVMSMLEAVMKLIVVVALSLFPSDTRVVFYAVLLFVVSIVIRSFNSLYCHRHFPESKYKYYWDKKYFKEMFSFAGWQMFGNSSCTLSNNGVNMLLNYFGGPIVNAARGLSYQVNMLMLQIITTVSTVISPFCVKSYAEGNKSNLFDMVFFSSKVYFIIEVFIFVPLFIFTDEVLLLWLGEIPEYTVVYVRYILVWAVIRAFHPSLDILFKSYGKIKLYQISEGIILLMPLLFSYLFLKLGVDIKHIFIVFVVFEFINLIIILIEARYIAELNLSSYIKTVLSPCIISFCIILLFVMWIDRMGFLIGYRLLFNTLIYILFVMFGLLLLLSDKEKLVLKKIVKKR